MVNASTSDADLWCSWAAGDLRAGQTLFDRYFRAISRFFESKVHGDHDDLIQETFAACIQGRGRLRDPNRFRSYLYGTAYNVLHTYYRKCHGALDVDALGSMSVHDLAPGPSTLVREDEQHRLLAEALRRIPLELQVAVELSYWEGMNSVEVGQVLGIPAGTVRTRLRRARELLAEAIEQLPSAGMRGLAAKALDAWLNELPAGPGDPDESP